MQTHIVPVGFDYDRLIVSLTAPIEVSGIHIHARNHARTHHSECGCAPLSV